MNFRGKVIKGKGLGRKLGFPTVNIQVDEDNLSEFGVYAGYVKVVESKLKAAIFFGTKESLEAHILDFNQDVYGQEIEVELIKKIREVVKFESKEELKNQIARDCEEVRKVL